MFRRALNSVLRHLFKNGSLIVTFSDGTTNSFGDETGEPVHIRFVTPCAERKMVLNPSLGFPEGFMDQEIEFEQGDVMAFMALLFERNVRPGNTTWRLRLMDWIGVCVRRFQQRNSRAAARRNVAHHYDLNAEFYDLFLDSDRQYSCAYFETSDATLEEAQLAKKRHIASKLYLDGGEKVLDIGCGWGGMGLYLAREFGASVTGVTLSEEQYEIANQRAVDAGLSGNAEFLLEDYRNVGEKFDRIVSIGMFEHVGVNFYREFFDKCRSLLKDDGVMVLHSIGRDNGPGFTHPFIRKYVFPGGYIPALSEVVPIVEKAGLHITDIEILRLHYAETLSAWRKNFMANRDRAREIYDEKFCRMWEFYLAGSESSFRHQYMMNFQLQLTPKRETLPITRDYMFETEKNLRSSN
ncbi:MAG: cyclopropane-fatty-acyl-phospholipid synthase family protein [Pseudomonadota bacterium]